MAFSMLTLTQYLLLSFEADLLQWAANDQLQIYCPKSACSYRRFWWSSHYNMVWMQLSVTSTRNLNISANEQNRHHVQQLSTETQLQHYHMQMAMLISSVQTSKDICNQLWLTHLTFTFYLYRQGGQHAVQRWSRSQFRPNAQPRDNRKVIWISLRL